MMETGAHALGCTVFPGGTGQTEQQVEAIADLQAERLRRHAGFPEDPARQGGEGRQGCVVAQARRWCPARRCRRRCARSWPRAASRCCSAMRPPTSASSPTRASAREGLIVDEGVLVEIVRPGTGDPVADGEVGEVVVTTFNPDYPLIRFATGDLSAVLPGALAVRPHQHAHQGLDGPRRPDDQGERHVRASRRRSRRSASAIPSLAALRLVVDACGRAGRDDAAGGVRGAGRRPGGRGRRHAARRDQAARRGEARCAGALPNDGKVIADERPVG